MDHNQPIDPVIPNDVDQAIRINELTEKIRELGGDAPRVSDDCPPEVHEQFLSYIEQYETAPLTTQLDELSKEGTDLPGPETMSDSELHIKLWEVIRALAAGNCFLHHTDHLSDRELYTRLRTDSLKEVMPDMKSRPGFEWHIDLISSGSDEDIEVGLRYYDTEEQRRSWKRDFPNIFIPPHTDKPFDRDRHLPQSTPFEPPADEIDDWGGENESE